MLLSQIKQNKAINAAVLTKKYSDAHWNKIFNLYKEKSVTSDVLIDALMLSEVIDKEIIETYGVKVFISACKKDK